MNVAFLFDASHPLLGVIPGYAVLRRILETQVLQESSRHVRVSIGGVLTLSATQAAGGKTTDDLDAFCRQVYVPKSLNLLLGEKLEATFRNSEVFCVLFQNLTSSMAQALHEAINDGGPYLGAMDVDFSLPLHLLLFRNSLVESFRLRGHECSVFYMTINEDPDLALRSLFEETGFEVAYEDMGLRMTIFDDYDTLEHFQRIADFDASFVGLGGLDADAVSNLTSSLEELHPKLFNGFAAAARTLSRAETEEDLAQAALSGRRLLEQVADYLFPPRTELRNGRKVGREQYKNRLWAYLEETVAEAGDSRDEVLQRFGKEADRLVNLFNAGLHHSPSREKVEGALRDLSNWLSMVIDLSPMHARRPYLAYEENLKKMLTSHVRNSNDEAH